MKPEPIYDDKWLWLMVRRLLLGMAQAIALRYGLDEKKDKAA